MLVVGANAVLNPNSIPVSNSPAEVSPINNLPASTDANSQSQIAQLQSLVAQYQNREKQYQAQISQLNSQLQDAQSILAELQRRGIIRIGTDGSIQLRR
jgi:Tfp pilus assembly protein FimV